MSSRRAAFTSILQNPEVKTAHISVYEIEILFCSVLSVSRTQLYLDFDDPITDSDLQHIQSSVAKLVTGMPVAYAVSCSYFYKKMWYVDPRVLIPRPETEILVETVLTNEDDSPQLFIDVGCGSGIIAESLISERPQWTALATDVSFSALTLAKKNSTHDLWYITSDVLHALKPRNQIDFIVSNPPYIPSKLIDSLEPSVKDWEPHLALDGGEEGLDFYHYFAKNAKHYLKPQGSIYCEIGYNQGADVTRIFQEQNWIATKLFPDLGQRTRVFYAQLPGDAP